MWRVLYSENSVTEGSYNKSPYFCDVCVIFNLNPESNYVVVVNVFSIHIFFTIWQYPRSTSSKMCSVCYTVFVTWPRKRVIPAAPTPHSAPQGPLVLFLYLYYYNVRSFSDWINSIEWKSNKFIQGIKNKQKNNDSFSVLHGSHTKSHLFKFLSCFWIGDVTKQMND